MTLTHGSLFSGIGGFELGAKWAGIPTLWNCELEPFNRKILTKHFPESHQYEDVTKLANPPYVDIISGGFPCQPFSTAGKRKGVEDNRFLWPEMLRVISEVKPKYIIGENVAGLVSIDKGMVLEQVYADLEAQGYEVQPFIIPACALNAPHRRDRVWIIAYSSSEHSALSIQQRGQESPGYSDINRQNESRATANTNSLRWSNEQARSFQAFRDEKWNSETQKQIGIKQQRGPIASISPYSNGSGFGGESNRLGISGLACENDQRNYWQDFPTQSPVCGRNDGVSFGMAPITVPSRTGDRVLQGKQAYGRWRKEALKSLGNGIVPQIAKEFFECIKEFDKHTKNLTPCHT